MTSHELKTIFLSLSVQLLRISELVSGWPISITEMAEIGKQTQVPDPDLMLLAKTLYDDGSDFGVTRVGTLKYLVESISELGFRCIAEYSIEEMEQLFDIPASPLPRIVDGNKIDDGRHRIAAMLANGYEEVPVSEGRLIVCFERDYDEISAMLLQEEIDAIVAFGKTDKYLDWKNRSLDNVSAS